MPISFNPFFSVKKIVYVLTIVIGPSLGGHNARADILKVNGKILCSNTGAVSVKNNVYSVACRDSAKPVPVPSRNPTPPPVVTTKCGAPEPVVRTEILGVTYFEKEFTLKNRTVLVVPFNSRSVGNIRKLSFIDPAIGEHFRKTIIVSKCKGVYSPEDFDYKTSTDVCVVTGLEISFSVITGLSRADHPISSYRCVLEPNTQYYINVFQYDSGSRPPYIANKRNTCRTDQCGLRVLLR